MYGIQKTMYGSHESYMKKVGFDLGYVLRRWL